MEMHVQLSAYLGNPMFFCPILIAFMNMSRHDSKRHFVGFPTLAEIWLRRAALAILMTLNKDLTS